MAFRFTVLASGSAGNASLLENDGFGVLLDIGLGPRLLARRLTEVGASWRQVRAVLLTHTHSDHWNDRTLAHLRRLGVPLYCHRAHPAVLESYGREFAALAAAGLVHSYEAEEELTLTPGMSCRPLQLRHDGGPTFGFRLESGGDLFGERMALGYAADLGSWTPELVQALIDVDVLALEFNHDVDMQYASGRSPRLIHRVLGDAGHLSNVQAAALLTEVLQRSAPGRLRHVVQLHLSRDCNCPRLALATAQAALAHHHPAPKVHTAYQDRPTATIEVGGSRAFPRRPAGERRLSARRFRTPSDWLPGLGP
jgi:phosphoribosyl 1,2-cyclic phosphodiesterase